MTPHATGMAMTDSEELRYLPWGTVTPQFWARDPSPHGGAGEQLHARTEPHATSQPVSPSAPPTAPRLTWEPVAGAPGDGQEARAGTIGVTAAAATEPADDQAPAAFRPQLKAIDNAILQRRFDEAADRAASVDEQITAAYGPGHLHTINARELRGFIAHLAGDDITGCRWYLHTVGLRIQSFGTDDPGTRAAAREAAALWQRIQDPEELRLLGAEVIRVLTFIEGEGSRSVRATRARLARTDGNALPDTQRPRDSPAVTPPAPR